MKITFKGVKEFSKALSDAVDGGLKAEYALWLEAMGFEFLDLVQDEIIRTKTVDTRRLLNSFGKGDGQFWEISSGGLSLEVGTNLNYARYVNDGHWTNKKGVKSRWIPGIWKGDRFEYTPGAKTGMLLKQKWIEGSGYWDSSLAIFERIFKLSLDRRLQEWIDRTF